MHRKKPLEAGRIIAELNFGFWTSLFNENYEKLWSKKLLKEVFPNIPRKLRNRKSISKHLNEIRKSLGNRIFHHEPIWKHSVLNQHNELITPIGWMNSSMQSMA